MLPTRSWIRVALCLALCSESVIAGILPPARRADASSTTTVAVSTTKTTASANSKTTGQTTTEDVQSSSVTSASITVSTTSSSTAAATAVPSALNGNTFSNTSSSYSNTTVAEGELPLTPRVTPGWGVAGTILLITGAVYAVIGIKNNWLHTFFSVAFLAGMCTAVLIVYVMTLPVSDGVQGAYVVACVCAGAILGGAATIFKELTEGLGCLLGGFCLSMWLLTLREGGLLADNNTGTIIFIIVFTFAGLALYFSHYTRGYALIWSISFSGATATVLGIDCFSRAGLKEFWAYIWALNDDLFPLGTDTYPLTKGIRVEIALIIIFCILGMISQLRLWKVVQEHRQKRATARAEAERQRDIEEAHVGQQIEAQAARERQQWEATYGDKTRVSLNSSNDSGVGDLNEKKGRASHTTVRAAPGTGEDVIEMTELPRAASPMASVNEFVEIDLNKPDEYGRPAIRAMEVASPAASGPPTPTAPAQDKVWITGADGEARPASIVSQRNSQRFSRSTAPDVAPLPFRVPDTDEAERDDDDRSSLATFADDDDRSFRLSKRASRASLGNRLSVGSGHLLRSLSRSSLRSNNSKRKTGPLSPTGLSHTWTGSQEDLVSENKVDEDAASVAATVDGMSLDGDENGLKSGETGITMEITADLNKAPETGSSKVEKSPKQVKTSTPDGPLSPGLQSNTETVGTDILSTSHVGESSEATSNLNPPTVIDTNTEVVSENEQAPEVKDDASKKPSSATLAPPSLTKDHLPARISRVASAYRTNEWAKHLSQADMPEPENLRLSQVLPQEEVNKDTEAAAPVKVEELQQTAENATPPPALVRSPSSASHTPSTPGVLSRSNSRLSTTLAGATPANADKSPRIGSNKKSAPPSVHATRGFQSQRRSASIGRRSSDLAAEPIAEEHAGAVYAESQSIQDGLGSGQISPAVADYSQAAFRPPVPGVVSYASPQTLLGKREMLIRNKSSILSPPGGESMAFVPRSPASDAGSSQHFASYSSLVGQDPDDMPLSQRKLLIRRSSIASAGASGNSRPASNIGVSYSPAQSSQFMTESSKFDSHQPKRSSTLPSQQAREAQLAGFRDSVARDMRVASPPVMNISSRDFLPSQSLAPMHHMMNAQDVQRNLDYSRNMLLNQRTQEAQRKEAERLQREHNNRIFEESMRSNPQLMDAHRDAMRRMQSSAK